MNGNVENFRVMREFTVQKPKELYCRVWLILGHGASYAGEASLALEVLVPCPQRGLLQEWERFLAMAAFGESDALLDGTGRLRCRSSLGNLPRCFAEQPKEESRNKSRGEIFEHKK